MGARSSHSGFTITELLVVVVVLFIAALLVLPMLSNGGRPITPVCLNNQRQIALCAIIYKEDHGGRFPNLDHLPGNDGPVTLAATTNYLKRLDVFMCPFVTKQREDNQRWFQKKFAPEFDASFFRSNGNDYAYYDGLVAASSTNPIVGDRMAWTNRSAFKPGKLTHARRINVAFSDGHAENLRPDRVVGGFYDPPWSAVQDPLLRP